MPTWIVQFKLFCYILLLQDKGNAGRNMLSLNEKTNDGMRYSVSFHPFLIANGYTFTLQEGNGTTTGYTGKKQLADEFLGSQ